MKLIRTKGAVVEELAHCLEAYRTNNLETCIKEVHQRLLMAKVKFPLLQYCATEFYHLFPEEEQIYFCDQVAQLQTEGGNVILGMLLQLRLENHFEESFQKAVEYIVLGNKWYVCDIIGGRVFGYSLLTKSQKTIPFLQKLSTHNSYWVVRSLGAGIHYAVKKGLDKDQVQITFELLLNMSNTTNKQVRQGVGWAAKTTAKFHPDIIDLYQKKIQNTTLIPNWFRKKIQIGLDYNTWKKKKSL